MSLIRYVGEAVIWTVSTEEELQEALRVKPDIILIRGMIQCRSYPIYLCDVRIGVDSGFGGLSFDIGAGQKNDNLLVLAGDVCLRHLSVSVSFNGGFFPDKNRMFAVLWVNEPGASLGDVSIKLNADALTGDKYTRYSGIYTLSPFKIDGWIEIETSGKYVAALSGNGSFRARCIKDSQQPGAVFLRIEQHNSCLLPVDGCRLELDDCEVSIREIWTSHTLQFIGKRFFRRLKKIFSF